MTERRPTGWSAATGPALGFLLVGLLLLSGLLYYRAVNVQRFLEPALALSLPRSELSQRLADSLQQEFRGHAVDGIRLRSSSVVLDKELLFTGHGALRGSAQPVLRKLARVYLSALDENVRPNVSMVLVIARYHAAAGENGAARNQHQHLAETMLDAMFRAEPELAAQFGQFFASTAMPASMVRDPDSIELQIVPSELMHAGVLQKLVKYVQ